MKNLSLLVASVRAESDLVGGHPHARAFGVAAGMIEQVVQTLQSGRKVVDWVSTKDRKSQGRRGADTRFRMWFVGGSVAHNRRSDQ